MYARCLLRELGKDDDFDQWVRDVVAAGTDETDAYKGVGELLGQLLKKVQMGEQWHLPESRYGSTDRTIVQNHPKEITFAMRSALDAALTQRGSQDPARAFSALRSFRGSRQAAQKGGGRCPD